MQIRVLAFAHLREALGQAEPASNCRRMRAPATPGTPWLATVRRSPLQRASTRFARNGALVSSPEEPLARRRRARAAAAGRRRLAVRCTRSYARRDRPARVGELARSGDGGVVTFAGVVRDTAERRPFGRGLSYEAHEPMADRGVRDASPREARERFGDLRLAHRPPHRRARRRRGCRRRGRGGAASRRGVRRLPLRDRRTQTPRADLEEGALRRRSTREWKANARRVSNVELFRVCTRAHNPVAVLWYEPRRPRGVTLVAGHGYSSSKQNLDFLCSFLASHGFGVYSLDFPGHKLGASGGELRGVDDCIDAMSRRAALRARARRRRRLHDGPQHGRNDGNLHAPRYDTGISGTIAIATGYGRPTSLEALQKVGATDFRSSYVVGVALPELVAGIDARYAQLLPRLAGRPALYVAAQPRRHGEPAAAFASSTIARRNRSRSRRSTAITPMPAERSRGDGAGVAQRAPRAERETR